MENNKRWKTSHFHRTQVFTFASNTIPVGLGVGSYTEHIVADRFVRRDDKKCNSVCATHSFWYAKREGN